MTMHHHQLWTTNASEWVEFNAPLDTIQVITTNAKYIYKQQRRSCYCCNQYKNYTQHLQATNYQQVQLCGLQPTCHNVIVHESFSCCCCWWRWWLPYKLRSYDAHRRILTHAHTHTSNTLAIQRTQVNSHTWLRVTDDSTINIVLVLLLQTENTETYYVKVFSVNNTRL